MKFPIGRSFDMLYTRLHLVIRRDEMEAEEEEEKSAERNWGG